MKQVFCLRSVSSPPNNATSYLSCTQTPQNNTQEYRCQAVWPTAGAFRNLVVRLRQAPGVGKSWTFTLRNTGVNTAVVCTVSGTDTTARNTANSATFAPGDVVALKVVPSGTPAALDQDGVEISLEFEGDTIKESGSSFPPEFIFPTTAYRTGPFAYSRTWTTGAGSTIENVLAAAGNITALYAYASTAAPGSGKSIHVHLYKNGVKQDGAGGTVNTGATISDTSQFGSASFTLPIAAGDTVYLETSYTGSPSANTISCGTRFVANTDGESQLCGYSAQTMEISATRFNLPESVSIGGATAWSPTESSVVATGGVTTFGLSKFYVKLQGAPGVGKNYTLDVRNNLASSGTLSVAIADAATTGNDTSGTINIADDDTFDLRAVPSGTPTAQAATWGLVQTVTVGSPTPDQIIGSLVAGVTTTVAATRAIAFGLDGNTNVHDTAGMFKVFGDAYVTGDLTVDGSLTGTIAVANDSITNAKLADMAQSTIKGRAAGAGTGDPTDLSATQATAILNAVVGDSGSGGTKGLVPAPGSGDAAAGKFLKADGTFAVPTGTGATESFKTIAISGQSDVVADSATDTLTLVAGSNVTLTTNAGTDTITIAATTSALGDLLDVQFVRATSDESVSNNAVLQDDDELVLAIGASQIWRYTLVIGYSASTAGDIQPGFTVPSGATGRAFLHGVTEGAAGTSGDIQAFSTTSLTGLGKYGGGGAFDAVLNIELIVVNSTNAGNVQFQFAQGTSNGTATIRRTNSFMRGERFA